ncbi:MAG: MFS transporter [Candidatus Kariarchaeaceae archaeon]|jgi:MFS family permease
MYKLNTFLGLDHLPEQSRDLMKKYTLIRLLHSLFINLSHTFFILFIIDSLGFKQASMITAFLLFTQMVFDYPSGSLGDYIGHKWVLTMSYLCYTVGYIILSFSETIVTFVIIAIAFGLGHAQASGTLQAYLDNNYEKIPQDTDPERKNYGFSLIRISTLDNLAVMIAFIIGGTLATLNSRQFVFGLQSVLTVILIFTVLSNLRDPTNNQRKIREEKKAETIGYSDFMKGGVSFVFSSRTTFYYIVGFSIFNLIWTLWSSLILFPIYYGYTGNDSLSGLLRSFLYFAMVILSIKAATWTKQVSNIRLPVFIISLTFPLFIGTIGLLYFIPYRDQFNLLAILIVMILIISTVSLLSPFIWTLHQRILLDLVPSENRNGVYSLMPTMTNAFAIPLLPVMGLLIENNGLISGVVIVLIVAFIAYLFILTSIRSMYPNQKKINVEKAQEYSVYG